jgi:hypothetical protein
MRPDWTIDQPRTLKEYNDAISVLKDWVSREYRKIEPDRKQLTTTRRRLNNFITQRQRLVNGEVLVWCKGWSVDLGTTLDDWDETEEIPNKVEHDSITSARQSSKSSKIVGLGMTRPQIGLYDAEART